MTKFKNKYRITSARAQWWNYEWNGAYFITICTKNRKHFFGKVENGKMNLSKTGVIAHILWYQIPNHAQFVELGNFVVMPNHIHGILILNIPHANIHNTKNDGENENRDGDKNAGGGGGGGGGGGVGGVGGVGGGGVGGVETGHALSLRRRRPPPQQPPPQPQPPQQQQQLNQRIDNQPLKPHTIGKKRFQNIGKNSVSSIIGSYKSAVTKHSNRLGLPNGWHQSFHDHIIRNNFEYQIISNYIIKNPTNWQKNKFNSLK